MDKPDLRVYTRNMKPSECICTNLRQAALASTAIYDAFLAPAGLKVTMFRLLRRIAETPGLTITELADIVGLDRSTLGRNVKVLERQGYVALADGADDRMKALNLTAEGEAALTAALPLWARAQAEMAALLGDQTSPLIGALQRIASYHPHEPAPGDAVHGHAET